ncbi:MAG: DUF2249 domain-containing protein [Sulfobacillus thermosulfidooxidans]|uniref:DUF2249 domain-containing protein n=1 Tax=Sulfobacillus thermotolerans TaxID=338644 RepID=A0ABM6RTS4_9FIRM|nr:DUF2249 domain-containing protein [Sulfobacillus sp. hq2]AUW94708.1 hypothetical protein BXT84_12745 [Sulfobacillus thermotolerans]MCY0908979.1 DUF2249 domain-containing protein [Sulfobacillus thermotolerans]POB11413.1 hypothetical protein CO251_04520 [Sulfobacillus sp. hq2]PSR34078.1 MAG: DUF2249 domain-containing protein [Sulfobacillus thermosulfidooxidans]
MKELDVRPMLNAGVDPFDDIMAFVAELRAGEGFRLWATFRPNPLLNVLAHRGYEGQAREISDGNWAIDFTPTT